MAVKITETNIEKLRQDDKNFNKGTKMGRELIDKSIRKFGAGRSILLDKNNRIIAGNKTQELAREAGIKKVIVVDAKPDELVAVRRGDVDLDSEIGREMALADNATGAANLDWDDEALARAQEEIGIAVEDWGVELPFFGDETKVSPDDYGDSFSLPDGGKGNVETMSFTLSSEQAEFIKEQVKVSQYDDADTFGNTNKNGNALYAIVKQWADVRK